MLPGGRPSTSNDSDAAAISVIKSLKDNEPRTTTTMLLVLWSATTMNGIYGKTNENKYIVSHK